MISVMVAKWVGDAFGEEGIYGIWIAMRRYPWLAPVEYKDKGEVAGEVMIPVDNLVVVRSGVDKLSHLGEPPSCAACLEFHSFTELGWILAQSVLGENLGV